MPPPDDTHEFEQQMKAKQKQRTVLIVVAVSVFAGGAAYFFMQMGSGLGADQRAASRAFLADCAAGRYEAAHARLAHDVRQRLPLERFKKLVAADKRLTTYKKMSRSHQTVSSDRSYLEGKLRYAGGSVKAQIILTKEQGQWKISGLVLGEKDLLAGPLGDGGG